jgi:hypothetical protein
VFALHVVASRATDAYERFPLIDVPMHFVGGVAITFFFGRSYRVAERLGLLGQPASWLYFVTVPALAATSTVLWEFAEFISDRYFGGHAQAGLEDTLFDMFVGCAGALVFLIAAAWRVPSSRAVRPDDA